jgi:hypothetical protein
MINAQPSHLLYLAIGGVGLCLAQAAVAATAAAPHAAKPGVVTPNGHSRYAAGAMPESARRYYANTWGVDQLSAQLAESGQLVRFSYRIVDIALARPLLDKASSPSMLDERAHAVLAVPTMEKVGPLRQSGAPAAGKVYWVLFSNKGDVVRAGDRVSVVIGSFRVDGLVVNK